MTVTGTIKQFPRLDGNATDDAKVADAPLTAGTVTLSGGGEGGSPTTLSAAFTDANLGAPTSDFSGHDQLGRRQHHELTSGDVAADGGGAFTVSGSHLYVEDGQ